MKKERDPLGIWLGRAAAFRQDAHALFGTCEGSKSRVISVDETRKRLTALSLRQDSLFRQALLSVEHDLNRAAVVLAWAAFIDFLEMKLAADGLRKLHDTYPAWRRHTTIEDLREHVPEYQLIEASREVGLLRKSEAKSVQGLLAKRNESAHPGITEPTLNETLGYITDLLGRVSALTSRI
jgi:hypothetical protein